MNKTFFPPRTAARPTIYAYQLVGVESHIGILKVGYTDREAQQRVAEQLRTARLQYEIVLEESAMRNDGAISYFEDSLIRLASMYFFTSSKFMSLMSILILSLTSRINSTALNPFMVLLFVFIYYKFFG